MSESTHPPFKPGSAAHTETMVGAADQELAAATDRYLRLAADFDNFRKRTTLETDRRAALQKEGVLLDLLPTVDNLERALAVPSESAENALRQGVHMIRENLLQLLRRHGIEPEETDGRQFDPHRHKAALSRHDPARPDQSILETLERGYRRGADVFRPATVVINDLD
jgi:molecular chaperone GrpE